MIQKSNPIYVLMYDYYGLRIQIWEVGEHVYATVNGRYEELKYKFDFELHEKSTGDIFSDTIKILKKAYDQHHGK